MPTTSSPERTDAPVAVRDLDRELAGLDALELSDRRPRRERLARIWGAVWPKLAATGLGLAIWQCVVWSGWKPDYLLPGPVPTLRALWAGLSSGVLVEATVVTLQRAALGFGIALVVGVVVGAAVSQVSWLRSAFGSLITGLQTMPSIAWFPLAIVLFELSEAAILFVVVLGAAPAIANGLIAGSDNVPPLLLRAGRVMGARRPALYREVVLPASVPHAVTGLKQGWAFAWRSLMAGELLVILGNRPSIGFQLQNTRQLSDYAAMTAVMLLILLIGIAVDTLVFGTLERAVRRRWGLLEPA